MQDKFWQKIAVQRSRPYKHHAQSVAEDFIRNNDGILI